MSSCSQSTCTSSFQSFWPPDSRDFSNTCSDNRKLKLAAVCLPIATVLNPCVPGLCRTWDQQPRAVRWANCPFLCLLRPGRPWWWPGRPCDGPWRDIRMSGTTSLSSWDFVNVQHAGRELLRNAWPLSKTRCRPSLPSEHTSSTLTGPAWVSLPLVPSMVRSVDEEAAAAPSACRAHTQWAHV